MNSFFSYKKAAPTLLFLFTCLSLVLSSCKATGLALSALTENTYAHNESLGSSQGKTSLRVISFNTKNCENGEKILEIAGEIKRQSADLVFLQEIDKNVKRSGRQDILKKLSEALEMNYAFFPAIKLEGGEYGIGILSKYPISNAESFPLESGEEEGRTLAKAEISVKGRKLDIFNTHLSYESTELRIQQFNFINKKLAESDNYILGGDFNVNNFCEYSILHNSDYINCPENQFISFNQCKDGSFGCIDNIVFSKNIGLLDSWMTDSAVSDHNLIAADFDLSPKSEASNVSHETMGEAQS